MKLYNSYIISIALALLLTTVMLIATGQNALDIYYTIYIVEALVITELFAFFNARARRGLTLVSSVLFAGFLVVLSLQVIKVLI